MASLQAARKNEMRGGPFLGNAAIMESRMVIYLQCLAVLDGKIQPFQVGDKTYTRSAARKYVEENWRNYVQETKSPFSIRKEEKQTNLMH